LLGNANGPVHVSNLPEHIDQLCDFGLHARHPVSVFVNRPDNSQPPPNKRMATLNMSVTVAT
jgi:hypothetical protein